uniref:Protein takeout n=3 Tax=Lygus hesperus TaxID=30085 RepID=A0A0K8SNB3_LYGHE
MWWLVVVSLCVVAVTGERKKLPAELKVCKRNDPNVNECVKQAIQDAIPRFKDGVPDLGIEQLDPFFLGDIALDKKKHDGSPVDIDLSWNDVVITGIKSAKVVSVVADWDHNLVSIESTLTDPIDIKGKYNIDGMMLILPIKGSGDFDCKLEGFKAHIKIHGVPQEVDGKKYMMVDRMVFTFDTKHAFIDHKNLFNGDKILGDAMNAFLNENWRDIVDELKPAIEAALSSHFQPVVEKVFNVIPIDEIALP